MRTRILVVDDSPTIRKVVSRILTDKGYETTTAENGEQGLARLREAPVDLVLTDFVMPKMNGYQFCREVRSDPKLRTLPLVLMSAKGDKIRGQFVQQTGAIDAITKPFDPLALVAVIENALSRRETAAPASDPASGERKSGEASAPHRMSMPSIFPKSDEADTDKHAALSGDLSCVSIAEVLQLLELQRQTGALAITNGHEKIAFYLRNGKLDLAIGSGLDGSLRLGRVLVRQGAISRDALTAFLENRTDTSRLLGDALVQEGLVTEKQVHEALTAQTSELVYEIVNWKSGRFTFMRDATCPEATLAQLGLVAGGILMEGFRRVDEWQLIEGSFDFDDVLQRDPMAIDRMAELAELTAAERAVLEAVDGERAVRQIVELLPASTFEVCKILYQFLNSRLVRRHQATLGGAA